jgi:anti-anti-sigma regulatory factor
MTVTRRLDDSWLQGTTAVSASGPLSISIGRAGGSIIVSMSGQLTAASGAGIDYLLADLLRDQGNLHVVIELAAVTEVDSRGLALLRDAERLAIRCGATLTVRNPPESIRWALEARSDRPS